MREGRPLSDDRPKFVGIFQAAGVSHGPTKTQIPSGPEMSCTYSGENAWAVDEHGGVWNLARYTGDFFRVHPKVRYFWVKTDAGFVRDPKEQP